MYDASADPTADVEMSHRLQGEWVNLSEFIAAGEKTTRVASGEPADPSKYWTMRALVNPSLSERTKIAYRKDWKSFFGWCSERNIQSLPAAPLAVAAHLAWMANEVDDQGEMYFAPSSISRRLTTINTIHFAEGLLRPGGHPHVMATLKGIQRLRNRPAPENLPLLLSDISTVVQSIDQNSWPNGVGGHRDVAILILGVLSGYRRSKLVQMRIGDVEWDPRIGIRISTPQSKSVATDTLSKVMPQSGAGTSTCAPCAFARWVRILAAAKGDEAKVRRVVTRNRPLEHICGDKLPELRKLDPEAPLFRTLRYNGSIGEDPPSGEVVNAVVSKRVEAVGMDPAKFTAHSLRKGFFQQAINEGVPIEEVMLSTSHLGRIRNNQVFNHAVIGKNDLRANETNSAL